MHISRKKESKKIQVDQTTVVYEYPIMDRSIHGALVKLNGRYPKTKRIVNEKCAELVYVVKGFGKLVVEDEEVEFKEGDQLFIGPQEKYYWNASAVLFMPCAPAWYSEQHKEID